MAEREKYYIGLNGQIFEVSKELYETYYKGQRKEKYFTHDLKQGKYVIIRICQQLYFSDTLFS